MKNLKLSLKLIGGFGAVALITLIVGFIGWIGVSNSAATSRKLNHSAKLSQTVLQAGSGSFELGQKGRTISKK